MSLEGYDGRERVLLSYDALGATRGRRVQVCRIVFGRIRADEGGRVRAEKGFIHRPGVVWVGQSVLILPPGDAEELAARLGRLGVRVASAPVAIERSMLGRFRRRPMA